MTVALKLEDDATPKAHSVVTPQQRAETTLLAIAQLSAHRDAVLKQAVGNADAHHVTEGRRLTPVGEQRNQPLHAFDDGVERRCRGRWDRTRVAGVLDDAAYVHFRAVVALLIVAVIVGWLIRGRRADRSLMVPAMWFIPFFIAQVVIGEVQWRNQLPWQVVLAHVTVAGVVWALGSAIAWRLARPITSRAAD